MSNIIPFESAQLPAHVMAAFAVSDDLSSGGGGFPSISIKGKVFHLKRGDEKTLITKPGEDDEPASSIEVVILKAFPEGGKTAKVYYSTGFVEGTDASPDCYSDDGVSPASDVDTPQASNCATCPHNQWGARITDDGRKAKACSDTKRLAVATVNQINDPMLVRVPAASLKALGQFNDTLVKRNVPYQAVVTKIGFDHSVAHPSLTFKPVGFIDEATAVEVVDMKDADIVKRITGQVSAPKREKASSEKFEQSAPPAKAEQKTEAKAEKPAKAEQKKPEAKAEKPAVVTAEDGLNDALNGIDFD